MVKAVFLDFYGTVVHEDGEVIRRITDIICDTGDVVDKSEVGSFWWNEFQTLFLNAYGEQFETQRVLEQKSLERTLEKFHSTATPAELSCMMFEHWRRPPAFSDALTFFQTCPLPIYIVSNIDTADIQSALDFHKLRPAGVYTSEDAESYKPRKELFEYALKHAGLQPDEVVHIGDSLSSDVKGAGAVGIHAIWLNRSGRVAPEGVISIGSLDEATAAITFENE